MRTWALKKIGNRQFWRNLYKQDMLSAVLEIPVSEIVT